MDEQLFKERALLGMFNWYTALVFTDWAQLNVALNRACIKILCKNGSFNIIFVLIYCVQFYINFNLLS